MRNRSTVALAQPPVFTTFWSTLLTQVGRSAHVAKPGKTRHLKTLDKHRVTWKCLNFVAKPRSNLLSRQIGREGGNYICKVTLRLKLKLPLIRLGGNAFSPITVAKANRLEIRTNTNLKATSNQKQIWLQSRKRTKLLTKSTNLHYYGFQTYKTKHDTQHCLDVVWK